jgi:predicted nucleotidyltransferase
MSEQKKSNTEVNISRNDNIARSILTYKDFKRLLDIQSGKINEGMFKNMAIDLQDLSAEDFKRKYKITKAEAIRKYSAKESVIDVPHKTYAKAIFDNADTEEPKLKESIRQIILKQIEEFKKYSPVVKFTLIGSILTKQYRDDADLDINVLFDVPENERETKRKEIASSLKDINGKTVPGTNHPINYFVLTDPALKERNDRLSDGIFDIVKNEFIKKPEPFTFNPEKYTKDFDAKVKQLDVVTGELKRDLIDYEDLKRMDKEDVEGLEKILSNKLKEIEDGIKSLIDSGDQTFKDRKEVFDADLTPDEIREFGKKNALPKNVIYKMLEKYHYLTFYKKLKAVMKDGSITDDELSSLTKESFDPNDMSTKFDFGLDDFEMDAIIKKYDSEDPLEDDDYLDIYDDDELEVIDNEGENLDENVSLSEVLSRAERIKSRIRFARSKAKRQNRVRLALKRVSPMTTINKRAKRLAINKIKRMFFKKSPAQMSVGEKERAERKLASLPKNFINRFAMKLVPTVRKIEKTRLAK